MQVKSIAECSKGSIPQYFRPSLSYRLSLSSLLCLFLSGRLRQVLLYVLKWNGPAHENLVLIAFDKKPPLKNHTEAYGGVRGLKICLSLHLRIKTHLHLSLHPTREGSVWPVCAFAQARLSLYLWTALISTNIS